MKNIYIKIIKPFIDMLLCFLGFIVLSPIMLVITIIISLESPGGAFFVQTRVGKDKKHFILYKFRTMRADAPKDTPTHMLDDPNTHITKMGKILRKFSLDELPQLINVIKGDMSIVGPRPALYNQHDLIAERDKYGANDIRPGITGLAQIKGRDELPIDVKAKYDGDYKSKISFMHDLWILIQTFTVVLKARGVKEGK